MNLTFSRLQKEHTQTLTSESEVFTNCKTIYANRIVNGDSVMQYPINSGNRLVLPAGEYKFKAHFGKCDDSECWLNINELSSSTGDCPDVPAPPVCIDTTGDGKADVSVTPDGDGYVVTESLTSSYVVGQKLTSAPVGTVLDCNCK